MACGCSGFEAQLGAEAHSCAPGGAAPAPEDHGRSQAAHGDHEVEPDCGGRQVQVLTASEAGAMT